MQTQQFELQGRKAQEQLTVREAELTTAQQQLQHKVILFYERVRTGTDCSLHRIIIMCLASLLNFCYTQSHQLKVKEKETEECKTKLVEAQKQQLQKVNCCNRLWQLNFHY